MFKFYLGWDIGGGGGDSFNFVVLLNQLNNVYKYVTNSGLSSMKSQYGQQAKRMNTGMECFGQTIGYAKNLMQ